MSASQWLWSRLGIPIQVQLEGHLRPIFFLAIGANWLAVVQHFPLAAEFD
jgi:hypothetical protein